METATADGVEWLRNDARQTLGEVRNLFRVGSRVSTATTDDWSFTPETVTFTTMAGEEVEIDFADADTKRSLAVFLEIPFKFFERQAIDVQVYLAAMLMRSKATQDEWMVEHDDRGIKSIYDPAQERVDPRRVLDLATNLLGTDAEVTYAFRTPAEYRFDVVVPVEADLGIGGDFQVGDITRGGISFGQNTQHNLAPYVNPYLFRLACTNGMVIADPALRIVTRNRTVADTMSDLEYRATQCMARIDHEITAFYELRNEIVANPAQVLVRAAREHGIPNRTTMRMVESLPARVADIDHVTMFDITNVITNFANHPDMMRRPARRRELEHLGGSLVTSHVARCPQCASRLETT